MKKISLYSVFFILLLISCNKSERAYKEMTGTWKIVQYQYLNYYGLRYYYPATGTYTFDETKGQSGDYQLNMTYTVDSLNKQMDLFGQYTFVDDQGEYFTMTATDTAGTTENIDQGRLILITKVDMKLEFNNSTGKHVFILER